MRGWGKGRVSGSVAVGGVGSVLREGGYGVL